jgi:hypothetical protein
MDAPEHFNCRCTPEPNPATLVGGACCGQVVPESLRKGWQFHVNDKLRGKIHLYERRTPNDPKFYFKASATTRMVDARGQEAA